MLGKDKCSVCGNYTDIAAKVTSNPNILYCKDCQDKEVQRLGRNFDLMKFVCIRCGSTNVQTDNLRTGINEDVINVKNSTTDEIIAEYAVARLSCIDCKNIFQVNILDNGPRTK
jgi:DNA-directed RNA polymerase subunit RPC12/RpoP